MKFTKKFSQLFFFLLMIFSLTGFTQNVLAYENSFAIFENITTIRFVTVKENIPDESHYFSGQSLVISGQMETDNNIFSFGNTNVSMKATMYAVSGSGIETLSLPPQFIIPNSTLVFTTHDVQTGSTTFSLPAEYGLHRIKIEAKAFDDEIEVREFDFWIHNPAEIILNLWATPSSVGPGQTTVVHWQANPTIGVSCWQSDLSHNGVSGSFVTSALTEDTPYSFSCNNGLAPGSPGYRGADETIIVEVNMPSVSVVPYTPVNSGEYSFFDYTSTNTSACNILKIDNIGGVQASSALQCPTSGRFYTGQFTNNNSSNISTHYVVECGTGASWGLAQTGDCNGPGASGNLGFNPVKNDNYLVGGPDLNQNKLSILEQLNNLISGLLFNKASAAPGDPNYSDQKNFSIIIKPVIPQAILDYSESIKDLVKKGNSNQIGLTYLKGTILNTSCTLQRNGLDIDASVYSVNFNNKELSVNTDEDKFRLKCDNGNLYSNEVKVKGQSGTLDVPLNCTIPSGGSTCPVTLTWSTTNPQTSPATSSYIKVNGTQVAVSGNNVSLYGPGSKIFKSFNLVDGQINGTTVENELATDSLLASCVSGTTWNGTICTPPPALADLIASDPAQASAIIGVPLNFTSVISNSGTNSTLVTFPNMFQVATGPNGTGTLTALSSTPASMPILSGGNSNTATSTSYTFTGSTGTRSVRACADNNTSMVGTVNEGANEGNNCSGWVNVTVNPSPVIDLVASAPTQTTATIGTPTVFTSVISNNGNVTTGATFYNALQVSSTANGANPISPLISSNPSPMQALTAGSSNNAASMYTFTGSAGTRSVRFCADNNTSMVGTINEGANEGNNCSAWVNVTVGNAGSPDLTASTPTPVTAVAGVPTTFSSRIINQGTVGTGSSFSNLFQISTLANGGGTVTNYQTLVSMPALAGNGGYATASRSITISTAGTYYIRACADNNSSMVGSINEGANEGNNCSGWVLLTVPNSGLPDLIISSNITPTDISVGITTAFSSTITNQGVASTGNSFFSLLQWSLDSNGLNPHDLPRVSINELSAGGVAVYSTTYRFNTAGDYYVRICADKDSSAGTGTITESNEINNCGPWTRLSVLESNLPDLIADVSSPSAFIVNTPSTLSAVISNVGTASTGDSFLNLFQTSTSSDGSSDLVDYTSSDMNMLDVGGSNISDVSVTFKTEGTYYVRACADKKSSGDIGLVVESDEYNNCSSWKSLSIKPEGSAVDGMCSVTAYICDIGTSINHNSDDDFYYWDCNGLNGGKNVSCLESKASGGGGGGTGGGSVDVSLDASPSTIKSGDITFLTWNSVGAISCTGSTSTGEIIPGFAGVSGANVQATPIVDTTYTMTCRDSGGNTGWASVDVKVLNRIKAIFKEI